MDGKRAFRSTSQTIIDPETIKLRRELTEEDQKEESEEERKVAKYASLKGHPGWEQIKKDFEATIDAYRSGRSLAAAIAKGVTNDELGALTRTANAIADELEQKILTVEGAALALEDNGPKRKKL